MNIRIKTVIASVGLCLGLASGAAAHGTGTTHLKAYRVTTTPGPVIHVSCYRGPWKDVIWDRPNAVFLDSLRAIGYDFPTSSAIAERICRDQNLVGHPEAMKAEMLRIYAESRAARDPSFRYIVLN